jgi:hypothetical protein
VRRRRRRRSSGNHNEKQQLKDLMTEDKGLQFGEIFHVYTVNFIANYQ